MSKSNRKLQLDEKLQILPEAETNGVDATCRKHQIARSLFYNWKNKFDMQGPDGLTPKYHRVDPQIKALEKENKALKQLLAEKELDNKLKGDLLKKKWALEKKKRL